MSTPDMSSTANTSTPWCKIPMASPTADRVSRGDGLDHAMIEVLAQGAQPLVAFDIRPGWGEGRVEVHMGFCRGRPPEYNCRAKRSSATKAFWWGSKL